MDISGPLRQMLRQHLPATSTDGFEFVARLMALPGEPSEWRVDLAPQRRPAHEYLGLALLLRALPRVGRGQRSGLSILLAEKMQIFVAGHQKLFFSRVAPPVDQLWFYWLLVLARKRLNFTVVDTQLKVLWQNAWSRQNKLGSLHAPAAESSPDAAAYNDLIALHVAYNAILSTHDFDLFPPVQRLADFHVQSIQPDHITTEPWALAAFAALDSTNTFAPQQIHDAATQLSNVGENPVILGLLADALMAQEEAAET